MPNPASGRILRPSRFVPRVEDMPEGAAEHRDVIEKLANEVLPWVVTAECLSKIWLYRAHRVYSWFRDFLSALAGFGVSAPLAKVITGESTDIVKNAADMPFWLWLVTFSAAIMWTALRIYVTREEGEKRAMIAGSVTRQFMSFSLQLRAALAQPKPLEEIVKLQKAIMGVVDRAIGEGAWNFSSAGSDGILAPGIEETVRRRTVALVEQYHPNWDDPPAAVVQVDQLEDSGEKRAASDRREPPLAAEEGRP